MNAQDRADQEKRSPVSDSVSYPRAKLDASSASDVMTRSSQEQDDHEEHQASHHSHFPLRLHEMLLWAERGGFDSVVSWLPGIPQNSFKVHRKDDFVRLIMPRFFKQTQYKSFIRQLNLWDFQRIVVASSEKGGYSHELFNKTNPGLCMEMKRTKIKGKNSKLSQHSKAAAKRRLATNTDILSDEGEPSKDEKNTTKEQETERESSPHRMSIEGLAFFRHMPKPNHISPQEVKYVQIGMDLGKHLAKGNRPNLAPR